MIDPETTKRFEASAAQGLSQSLQFLKSHFLDGGQFHRLFDVLKMEVRLGLGLKLLHHVDDPPLDEPTQSKLEEGLLDACRTVAKLYVDADNLNDAWVYLQPLGDEPFAREMIESLEVTDDSFSSIIEVAFNHGVSPVYGFKLMLEKTGTCNGITAFDVHGVQYDRRTIRDLASALLNHFYNEITANVVEHVRREKGECVETDSLGALLDQHQWLVREGGHHADATHLASVVRIARQAETSDDRRRALDLASYGCRLGKDFQFASEPPFENLYEDHKVWFEALCGINVESAIDHFADKADQAVGQYSETVAAEALVDLQILTGDRDAAVESASKRLLKQAGEDEVPPAAFDVARSESQFGRIAEVFHDNKNFAGYAFATLCQNEKRESDGN